MENKKLNKFLENLSNYKFVKGFDFIIDKIKENNDYYLVYFMCDRILIGIPTEYLIKKSNGEIRPLCLNEDEDLLLSKSFDYADFVNIPKKYINKIF